MKTSIIFVNFNSSHKIKQCLQSIENVENTNLIDIVVVDNSRNFTNLTDLNICVVENKENIGFGAAVNKGIPFTKSDIICIINPDTQFQVKFIEKIHKAFLEESVGLITLYQKDITGRILPTHGQFPNILETLSWLIPTNRFSKKFKNQFALLQEPNNREQNVKNIAGAFIAVRKADFEKVGGFDERFFLYYEDSDLSMTFIKKGYHNIILDPVTYIIHEIGNSDETQTSKKEYLKYMLHSRLLYLKKYNRGLIVLNKLIILTYIFLKKVNLSKNDIKQILQQ